MAKILDRPQPHTASSAPGVIDVQGLVDLCRLMEVPVGLAVAAPSGVDAADHQALKRQQLELAQAFGRIADPRVRQTLLNLVKAAATRE
jgi:hypothetical protein